MKKTKEKEIVLRMRLKGMSYSQIRSKVKISKSTLSIWLQKHPLSPKRVRELRDLNPQRIENCRNTKLRKRQEKLDLVYSEVKKSLDILSKREIYIAGLFLYWGEGTKAARDMVAFTNTDPFMVRFFVKWMNSLGIKRSSLKVKLHLYSDMKIKEKIKFWSNILDIPESNFRKPYVKDSKFSSLTYKNLFGQGTCSVIYGNSELHNKIMMSLKYFREVVSKL